MAPPLCGFAASRLCFRCLSVKERREKPPSLKPQRGSGLQKGTQRGKPWPAPVILYRPFRAPAQRWHGSAGRCPGLSWVAALGLGDSLCQRQRDAQPSSFFAAPRTNRKRPTPRLRAPLQPKLHHRARFRAGHAKPVDRASLHPVPTRPNVPYPARRAFHPFAPVQAHLKPGQVRGTHSRFSHHAHLR